MFCVYCGKRIPDNARFCSYCGKAVAVTADELDKDYVPVSTEGNEIDSLGADIEANIPNHTE